ncbi:MAG: M81 family metallopeptidase, partial [Oceanospirillaceae bacterium]|nr:M81 family metallopeptidase [Oceanospirillaceae bacterium]
MPNSNIAIAGFQHETNTFSPDLATYAEFMKEDGWPGLTEKSDIIPRLKNMNLPMAGFIEAVSVNKNILLHPIVWASAEPCGYVTQDAFDKIAAKICDGIAEIKSLDGIYLDLHGAMVTQNYQDGEGELLRRIRQLVGPSLPIVVSLDLHANISPAMVELSSAIAIFRNYPHLDMARSGARAYTLLQHLSAGKPLQKTMHQLPFLVPLTSQCTDLEPCKSIYKNLEQLNNTDESLISLDFALGFPAADTYDCGPCVVAYGTDQQTVDTAINTMTAIVLEQEAALSQTLFSADTAAKKATLNNS